MADGGTGHGWSGHSHQTFLRHGCRFGDRSKYGAQNHAAPLPFAAWFSSSICKSIIAVGGPINSARISPIIDLKNRDILPHWPTGSF
jgi:hypothetical protein